MLNIRKVIVACLLLVVLIVPNFSRVQAVSFTNDHAQLTQEERITLLIKLIEQVSQLQRLLKIVQENDLKQQVVEVPTPSKVIADDYTKGSESASIKIVTYTDFDCPFCQNFHTTLNTILDSYSDVSVTYRHFPLVQIHPNAKELSIAVECAGRLSGDTGFWNFTDLIFSSRNVNETTDMKKLESFAEKTGISATSFKSCRDSEIALEAVNADIADGMSSGVQGTPMSFVFQDGKMVANINGAQPYSIVKKMIIDLLPK